MHIPLFPCHQSIPFLAKSKHYRDNTEALFFKAQEFDETKENQKMMKREYKNSAPHHTQLMMISLNPRKELVAPTLPPSPEFVPKSDSDVSQNPSNAPCNMPMM
jgi:hypothetical protein